jgi:arylsulfatase A-like enzyme
MDKLAGEVLDRLQQDGLADDTLVVFWSDHGMGMPRGKRWIYDTGTLIPLIMRWPDKLTAGSLREDLTSVLDLPPTMLQVAGVEVPGYMHGRVLIGDAAEPEPSYLFFHRDRMDEAYELQRAARDRRWKYIRNFQPEKTYAQHIDYMDKMPAMRDWRRFAAEGKLVGGQQHWFADEKPIEELYDTETDPWELNNLAAVPQYAQRLARMREATEQWQQEIGDTGMIPEAVLMEEMMPAATTPRTQTPTIAIDGDVVSLSCQTEGASMVYQVLTDQGWSDWRLYTKSFPLDFLGADKSDRARPRIKALATRLGFAESEIAVSR